MSRDAMIKFFITHTPLLYLTQSLWRDEAFSVLLAEKSPLEIIRLTAQDFNPPFYYLLLHFWMKIFGQSEISVRMLSFIFHLLLVYVGFKFAQKIFKSMLLCCYVAMLLCFNPMLLYYGFEARMYSLLALLATLSMYHFYQKNWSWYILFTSLGLYTQPFMILVSVAQLAYLFFTSRLTTTIKLIMAPFIIYLPWMIVIFGQLKQSSQSWIHPIDSKLAVSSLGNLFLGFEGTPPYLWRYTKILSLIIFAFSLLALGFKLEKKKLLRQTLSKTKKGGCRLIWPAGELYLPCLREIKSLAFLFFLWVFLPLFLVLLISTFKPIYVNRYLIFVAVGEIFLIALGLERLKSKALKHIIIWVFCFLIVWYNVWFAPFHKKRVFRKAMTDINRLATQEDIILTNSALSFFEVSYYAKDRSLCFLLDKKRQPVPAYVGKILIPESKILTTFPLSAKRVFLVNRDASFEIIYQDY